MNDLLFCPLRKKWVAALPEEKIRQALIQDMTQRLGYPLGNLALEKSLGQFSHLDDRCSLPKRRVDLVVFAKNLHPQHALYPLLLIECKATPLNQKVLRQIVGYHRFVSAYFIAVVNHTQAYLGFYDPQLRDFRFREGFFAYTDLIKWAKSNPLSPSSPVG